MENTEISWCDATVNFWWGCTKVSPGCANCYADTLSKRWGKDVWGKGKPREDHRKGATLLAMKLERQAIREGRRLRVFCSSMADWLDDEVPIEWLADLLDLIRQTPNLDWLLLTKRPENWRKRLANVFKATGENWNWPSSDPDFREWLSFWLASSDNPYDPPDNIWIGTTVEDQQRADERIPLLLDIPARVRFVSCEPLLGPVDLRFKCDDPNGPGKIYRNALDPGFCFHPIHWVIAGGESGPKARPMHTDWARSLRDQCATAGVPFHFKQWGAWHETDLNPKPRAELHLWPDGKLMHRVGKKFAGRILDGVEHNAFPES